MKKPIFEGAGVAIVTPFNGQSTNYNKLGELIDFQIENGIKSIIICGTTGEASTMPDEEHIEVVRYTVQRANKRVPVIAGAGSNDTKHAIELSKKCEDVGADAILSVTPYYNKTSQRGLVEHFTKIANSVKIPILLYNVPTRTSTNIDPKTLFELSKVNNIIGVKECNFEQLLEAKSLCPEDFYFYSGNDDYAIPLMSLGGKGVISVVGNIIPSKVSKMADDYLKGNIEAAQIAQVKYHKLISAMFMDVNPIPVKAALNLMGYGVGNTRLPLVDLSTEDNENLKEILSEYNLI